MCSEFKKPFGDSTIQLVNLKEVDETEWTTYIGRENSYYDLPESMFANPYTLDEYERETAVRLYELWLFERLLSSEEFYREFCTLEDETVACWCLPETCHGEVLCDAIVSHSNCELKEHIQSRFEQLQVTLFGYSDEKEVVEELVDKPFPEWLK